MADSATATAKLTQLDNDDSSPMQAKSDVRFRNSDIEVAQQAQIVQEESYEDRHRTLVALAQQDRENFIGGYTSASDDVSMPPPESPTRTNSQHNQLDTAQSLSGTAESLPFSKSATTTATTAAAGTAMLATGPINGTEVIFPVTQKIIKFLSQFANQHPEASATGPVPSSATGSSNIFSSTDTQRHHPQPSGEDLAQAYKRLLGKMRDPSMSDILKGVRTFVHRFNEEHAVRSLDSNADSCARDEDVISVDSAASPVINGSQSGIAVSTTTTESDADENEYDSEAVIWDADCMPGENNPDMVKVQTFLRHLERKVKAHALWNRPNRVTDAEWDMDCEGLEKFVLSRIHKAAFGTRPVDKRLDEYLQRRIEALSFVQRKHLDIRETGAGLEESWDLAANELKRMNQFRAPRDKMVCVLNCCRVITGLLTQAAATQHQAKGGKVEEARLPGADEFLPALIHVVLRSNPPHLHSNIEYIASYRDPSRLIAEAGYFFTHLTSAVAFVQQLDSTMLSISKDVFEAGIAGVCIDIGNNTDDAVIDSSCAAIDTPSLPDAPKGDLQAVVDASEHAMNGLSMQLPRASEMEDWRTRHGRFMDTSSETLRVADTPELLEEYKYLANLCQVLLQERQSSNK